MARRRHLGARRGLGAAARPELAHEFGDDFGYKTAREYEQGASDVINNDEALNKTEKDDGDYVYYIEATNEFVVLSKDGYIRTYFRPDSGKKYYDKQ